MTEQERVSSLTGASPIHKNESLSKTLLGAVPRVGAAPFVLLLAFAVPLPVEGGRSLLGLPNLCPFRAMTGIPCPGCGMSRSLVCIAHGHIADAFRFNPVGPVIFLLLIAATLSRLPLTSRISKPLHALFTLRSQTIIGITLIICLLVTEAARLTGWLPAPP